MKWGHTSAGQLPKATLQSSHRLCVHSRGWAAGRCEFLSLPLQPPGSPGPWPGFILTQILQSGLTSLLSSVTSWTVNSARSDPRLGQRRTHSSCEAPGALEGGPPAGWSGHRAGLEGNLTPDSRSGRGAVAELTRPQVAGGLPDRRPGSSHPYLMPLGEGGWRHLPMCSPLVWGRRGPGGEPRPSLMPSLDMPVQGLALGSRTPAHCLV